MFCGRAGLLLTLVVLLLVFAVAGCGGGDDGPAVIADTGPPAWLGAPGIQNLRTGDQMARVFFNKAEDDDSPPVNFNVYYDTVTPIRFDTDAVKLASIQPVQNADGTAWSYDVTGLNNGTRYYFVVRAQDSMVPPNEEKNTVELGGVVGDFTPPAWNTTIGAQYVQPDNHTVRVYWNSATDAANPEVTYNIYYDTVTPVRIGAQAVLLGEVEAEIADTAHDWMYLVEGLDNGVEYYFIVRARDSALPPNEDTNTVELKAAPLDTLPPVWLNGEGILDVTTGEQACRVYWNDAEDQEQPEVTYNLYYDTVTPIRFGLGAVRVENIQPSWSRGQYDNEYTLRGLETETTYHLAIRALDSADPANEDSNTKEIMIHTSDQGSPEAPTGLGGTVNVIEPSQVILSWYPSTSPDVELYRVYRRQGDPGGPPPFSPGSLGGWDDITHLDLDPANTAFVDGLQPEGIPGANGFTGFSYVVTAVDHRGRESYTALQAPQLIPLGKVSYVLLVDNTGRLGADKDDSENFEHRQALIDLGLDEGQDFEIIVTGDYDLEAAGVRTQFEEDLALDSRMCVIWFTANAFEAGVMSDYHVGLLKDYLDGGGKLILDGDDILYALLDRDQDEFLQDYLGVAAGWDSVNDDGAADESDMYGVTGGIFANWSARRNEPNGFEDSFVLDLSSGAFEALAVNNWPAVGYELVASQKHDTDSGSYVFLMSIGLEDIAPAFKRENWMARIFNWMDVPLP